MSDASPGSLAADQASGRGVWIGVIAGLGFVVAANALMMTVALRNPPVRATDDHYGDALAYDEVIAARAATRALGWRVSTQTRAAGSSEGSGTHELALEVAGPDGRPLGGLAGRATLRRADSAELDRALVLREVASGRYLAPVSLGATGLYELEFELEGPAGTYVDTRRIWVEGG